jgi:hypothetical protein
VVIEIALFAATQNDMMAPLRHPAMSAISSPWGTNRHGGFGRKACKYHGPIEYSAQNPHAVSVDDSIRIGSINAQANDKV